MNEQEARELLEAEIHRLKALGYERLRALEAGAHEVTGQSGTVYTVETQAWDDNPKRPDGNLRVNASIDDGRGLRAFVPLSDSFIIAPDGTFVGKS